MKPNLIRCGVGLAAILWGGGCATSSKSWEERYPGRPRPEAVTVAGDDRELHVMQAGVADGPLVLLVHGTPGHWSNFSWFLADPVLTARARVVAMDRPGWGGSGHGDLETDLGAQAAAVAAVLRAYPDNRPAIVVGHSLGGTILARAALDYPELIDGALIVSASLDPAVEKPTWYQSVARWGLVRWAVPEDLDAANRELAPLQAEEAAMAKRWSSLRVPVIVMQGADDKLVPPAHLAYLGRVAPQAVVETVRLEDQGHLIPWQDPAVMRDAVLRLLDRIGSAAE